jgi:hypothetical protein
MSADAFLPLASALSLLTIVHNLPSWQGGVSNASATATLLFGSRLYAVGVGWLSCGFARFRKGVLFLGEPVADALLTDAVVLMLWRPVRGTHELSSIFILPGRFAGFASIHE